MSRLVVFDIDGTLTDTNDVDDDCFRRAVADIFALTYASVDWSDAPHITDSSLARWLCQAHCHRDASDAELARLSAHFVDLLRQEHARVPARFAAIPGAQGLFAELRAAGWWVALATGGWFLSAVLKLGVAGLHEPEMVLASASDALTRPEIFNLACQRAAENYRQPFTRVVFVGDAPWDVRTAAELGHGFVGVGRREVSLRQAGASIVLSDFRDREAVLRALETADVPAPGMSWQRFYSGTRADLKPGDRCYHGTRADLTTGDLIKPGYAANFGNLERVTTFVYFSATLDAGVWGAELARGEGPGRIYLVEPTGPFTDDPNLTDKRFPGNPTKSYRSREPLRVLGECTGWRGHPPEVLQAMKDHLAQLKQLGVEPIDD